MPILIAPATLRDLDALVALLAKLFAIEQDFTANATAQRRGLELLLGCPKRARLFVARHPSEGLVAAGIGVIGGTLLWGFGLWWLLLASLITIRYFRAGVPFNLGWWGYTFPLGVYSVATLKLGELYGLGFFSGLGTLLVMALALMWLFVSARTLHGGWKGHLFVSPCLATPQ